MFRNIRLRIRPSWDRFSVITLLVLGLLAASAPTRAGGWSWKLPPDLVTPESGKRSHVFYVGEPVRFTLGPAAARFEVRDYWGQVVDKGAAGASVVIHVRLPGWYKLYVYGRERREPWGQIVGGTTFVIFRRDPHFPPLPARNAPGGTEYPSMDELLRGVTGMGPQRHAVADAAKPDEAIAKLEADIALDRHLYLPFDPVRRRVLLVAFPNGTKGKEDGVRKIVAHFQHDVAYWEPRNEPNGGSTGADFARDEMKPFYEAVKSVNPSLKVLGPGTVSIGPQLLPWIEDFLKAGGAKSIDGFSFHAYNTVNGDLWLARHGLKTLNALLRNYGAEHLEKWQTEQGYFAAMYGAYLPGHQGRWTMLQMMAYEQEGIPKEHNHLWYDKSHGFWDFPTWWENEDGSLNPAAPLMRVWSEELYGTRFARAFDWGPTSNKLYLGSLFASPDGKKRVAAFQSAGSPNGRVELTVTGGRFLRVVSAFGVASRLPVRAGRASLAVPELPVYVELAPGQTLSVVKPNWGQTCSARPACRQPRRGQAFIRWTKRFPTTSPNSPTAFWKTGTGASKSPPSPGWTTRRAFQPGSRCACLRRPKSRASLYTPPRPGRRKVHCLTMICSTRTREANG